MDSSSQQKNQSVVDEEILAKQVASSHKIQQKIKQSIAIIGNQHRYQILLFIYLIFCFIFATFLLIGNAYFFMNPKFICNGQSLSEVDACKQLDSCTLQNDYTITSYDNIYCQDRKVQRQTLQVILGIGACFGVLFVNFVSDYKGRRFSFLTSLISGLLSTILLIVGAYTDNYFAFLISQLLAGFCGNSLLTQVYVISNRLMSQKYSNLCIQITNGFFGLTQVSFALFTGPLQWHSLVFGFMLIPCFIIIMMSNFILVEDPVFLFTKSRPQQCLQSLRRISKYNKTTQKLDKCQLIVKQLKQSLKSQVVIQKKTSKLKFVGLLTKKQVYVPIILIGLWMLGGNLVYSMFNYAISDTGLSYSLDVALFGIIQFVGILPMMIYGTKTPRVKGQVILVVIQIAFSAFFLIQLSPLVSTILVVTIRFIGVSQYMLYIKLALQTFPQHIQATSMGIIEFVGLFGKVFGPIMISFSLYLGISPILLSGVVALIMQLLPLPFLKQTLVKENVNVDDAKQSLLETEGNSQSQ